MICYIMGRDMDGGVVQSKEWEDRFSGGRGWLSR